MKRDGSLARSCLIDGKLVTGKKFGEAAAKWYKNIATEGPLLRKSGFPNLDINNKEIVELLRQSSCFRKAYSVDCVTELPFSKAKELR